MAKDDEDDEVFGGLYEDGHWKWDTAVEGLVFVSNHPPVVVEAMPVPTKAPTGTIEFRDDIDLIEQMRFRKRYMRKLRPGQPDVITVQDLKDLALYTAPLSLLSPALIDMLHLPTTERFLRALIFYCQYYLQTADTMTKRMLERETKVRTQLSEIVESIYQDDLCDLRTLVAKEYCTMLIGGADTKKFHHMGPAKKRQSLSNKDAHLFETLTRMSVQIVWLALGRRSFNQLELEVNRIFKSNIFNNVEHTLKTNFINKMSKEERHVLLGRCVRRDRKLNTCSPLMNEVFCGRHIDYRMAGLGVIKYPALSQRLLYMWLALCGPEEELTKFGVPCGILGYPRSLFDTMLRPLPTATEEDKRSSVSRGSLQSDKIYGISQGAASQSSVRKNRSVISANKFVYDDIQLPLKEADEEDWPEFFPDQPEAVIRCSERQRRRWHIRLQRLRNPQTLKRPGIGNSS